MKKTLRSLLIRLGRRSGRIGDGRFLYRALRDFLVLEDAQSCIVVWAEELAHGRVRLKSSSIHFKLAPGAVFELSRLELVEAACGIEPRSEYVLEEVDRQTARSLAIQVGEILLKTGKATVVDYI